MTKPNRANDSLFKILRNLRGNQRACVYTEPLFGIPYNLYIPFFTIYMYSLGVKDTEIGILLSVGLFFQLFAALFGGVLTDKFGRRKTTFIVDFIAWSIPAVLWAFSQNFWWFFAAAVVNSTWQITQNSWQCLMVEDAEPQSIVPIYNWVHICGLLAVFFAPLSSFFIGRYSLVPVMRVLILLFAVAISVKILILNHFSTETKQGIVRLRETKNTSLLKMLLGYKDVLLHILRTPATLRILALMTLTNITQMVTTNFFALYTTQQLGISDQFLAYFPMLRAVIMLLFFFGLQKKLSPLSIRAVMLFGLVLYGAAHWLLLSIPPGSVPLLLLYTGIDACACALFLPRRDSLMVFNVAPEERARIMSLIYAVMLGISTPFGYIAGKLSEQNRQGPFVLNLCLFAIMVFLVAAEKKKPD